MAVKGGTRANMKPYVKTLVKVEAIRKRKTPPLALAIELQGKIENMGEPVPKEETLTKIISDTRNHGSPEDEPWNLRTLNDYPIPSEALKAVLGAWRISQTESDMYEAPENRPLTIRQAKWLARIHALFHGESHLGRMWGSAMYLAETELLIELSGTEIGAGKEPEHDYVEGAKDRDEAMLLVLCWDADIPKVMHVVDEWMWQDEWDKESEASWAEHERKEREKRERDKRRYPTIYAKIEKAEKALQTLIGPPPRPERDPEKARARASERMDKFFQRRPAVEAQEKPLRDDIRQLWDFAANREREDRMRRIQEENPELYQELIDAEKAHRKATDPAEKHDLQDKLDRLEKSAAYYDDEESPKPKKQGK